MAMGAAPDSVCRSGQQGLAPATATARSVDACARRRYLYEGRRPADGQMVSWVVCPPKRVTNRRMEVRTTFARIGLVFGIAVSLSCARSPIRQPADSAPTRLPADTPVARVPQHPTPHGDTEEMLIPDPALRTWNRLWSLRRWAQRYVDQHGTLPPRLEDFAPQPSRGVDQKRDGWGQLIRYRLQGTGYELRSPGADMQIGTADDMVATAERLPDRPDGAP